MKVHFIPKTTLGKWSAGLIIAFIAFIVAFYFLIVSGQRGGETFFSNLALAVPMLIAGISGASAFFTGLTGIITSRERSIVVYLATLTGLLVLIFGLAEIIFPH
jgi:hypothetical protein